MYKKSSHVLQPPTSFAKYTRSLYARFKNISSREKPNLKDSDDNGAIDRYCFL